MKMSFALIKLSVIGLFAGSMASLDIVFSQPAYAGCGEFSANAWSVDASTEDTIEVFGVGDVTTCGNMRSSFASFSQENLSFGWSVCYKDCIDGWQPDVVYVDVNGSREMGTTSSVGSEHSDGECVQQFGSQIKYCWQPM